MILEGNNYDFDTLLLYLQDEQITPLQLVKHCSDNIDNEYQAFIEKNALEDCNESAEKFLDWYQDEDRDTEEEDMFEESDDMNPEGDTEYKSWKDNPELLSKLGYSKSAPKICRWRLEHPMEQNKALCARETNSDIKDVNMFWQTPNFLEECLERRLTSMKMLTEEEIAGYLIRFCFRK